MADYRVIRTDTADAFIHKIILDIAEKFGAEVALEKLDELEKQTILQALKTHAGNLSHAATALGISRAALYRRLEKYDIPVDK